MENDTELEDLTPDTELGEELDENLDADEDLGEDGKKKTDSKTYNDEDVDAIVKKKIAKLERKHLKDLEQARSTASGDDEELTREAELQQKIDEYEQKELFREREADIRKTFKASALDASDALIASLIRDDEDDTLEAVEAVVELVKQEVQKVKKLQGRRKAPADNATSTTSSKKESMADFARSVRIIKD